ncbi:hypothetical protein SCRM01_094c [Synechococcus phage S-CRM01]|uniref:hypothetical protein n=1 Tax=Synechococcus phage S-CRM01 TaxID=1026955 RepID=UPI000209E39A|nr:hypothetical protein SCRM01_094c [Synechococcus phage S-CRM01]AEC53040.1 hypothetical protein SCRM01_094c [Synechococcus phage S-CRM01]
MDEGFVDDEVSAEVFIEHMSDEWIESIIEGYKQLPVGKMKGQMFAHRVKSNSTKDGAKSIRYHTKANRIDDTLSGKRKPQVSRGKYAQQEKEKIIIFQIV